MVYIFGKNIPDNKSVKVAFTRIYGIGINNIKDLCYRVGISPNMKVSDVSDITISRISRLIERDFVTELDLKRVKNSNVKRLIEISCYRGLRHRNGLPVRGQRTRTNGKTQKRLGSINLRNS